MSEKNSRIRVLDCTLRDGGYCNGWRFGEANIRHIIKNLHEAKTDIIECGFLTKKADYNKSISKYTDILQVEEFLPSLCEKEKLAVMVNYGEIEASDLPIANDSMVGIIRIAFHKKDCVEACELAKKIKTLGYKVFLQPMVTMKYSDEEFEKLVGMANQISPDAFYIVDSFGTMNRQILEHYFEIADKQLNRCIPIGFHSHNNLQMAYANAQKFVEVETNRDIIVDASIHGMGRGAGNLNAELFMEYLNRTLGTKYNTRPLLKIMDEILSEFYENKPWGYSLPNYLSAVHMIHPNYANFLSEKKTLTIEAMDEIFDMMDSDKGSEFDSEYIENLYQLYMSKSDTQSDKTDELKKALYNREILLLAPGHSVVKEKDILTKFVADNKPLIISINHENADWNSDFVFVSNIRRFSEMDGCLKAKLIATSNIDASNAFLSVDYASLTNDVDYVKDNAGLMMLKLLWSLGVRKVNIAGMDGYSGDSFSSYSSPELTHTMQGEVAIKCNDGMRSVIDNLREMGMDISFLTKSLVS